MAREERLTLFASNKVLALGQMYVPLEVEESEGARFRVVKLPELWTLGNNRVIIEGKAGSGKSTLIHTIVATVRSTFQRNDVVRVCAPTGSAAFCAGGKTIHQLFPSKFIT